ncbi:MAG: T9SS type A sorting domain-containing protein [Bacteroidetes bacterium]|nr:MAG: T9SS type A sorting domain-containing protein [Bacteroidota bacterium]
MKRILFRLFGTALILASSASSQWLQTGGPYGASVNGLATSGTTVMAATMSGIYRTTNDGVTWAQASGIPLGAVVINLQQGTGGVYAATSSGPFVSTNAGVTWTRLDSTGTIEYAVAVFAKDSMIFAGTFHGMHRSTDLGKSWSAKDTSIGDREFKTIFAVGNVLFAGTTKGLFRSTNNGGTWKIADTLLNGSVWATGGALLGTKLYVSASNGVYVSPDTGRSWAAVKGSGIAQINYSILANGGNLYVGTGSDGAYRSTDGGENWTKTGALPSGAVRSLTARGPNIFAGTNWGISFSTNAGTTWTDMNTGITGTQVVYIGRANGEFTAATATSGLFTSINSGLTWNPNPNSVKNVITSRFFADSAAFRLGTNLGIYLSTDAGLSWGTDTVGLGAQHAVHQFVKNPGLFCLGSRGVYERVGSAWVRRTTGLPAVGYINTMAAHNGSLFCAVNDSGIFRSTNNGALWTYAGAGIPNTAIITAMYGNGSRLYAASYSGVFLSTDNGATWKKRSIGLPAGVASLVTVNEFLFAGTYGDGVYVMNQKDTIWKAANTGMPTGVVSAMFLDNGALYIGTSSGIWKRSITEMITSVRRKDGAPAAFELTQNYPNPFNPATTIRYSLPSAGHAALTVYDILGKEVATLVNGMQNAGTRTASFDASHLPSGIYFARLSSGSYSSVIKMTLMK